MSITCIPVQLGPEERRPRDFVGGGKVGEIVPAGTVVTVCAAPSWFVAVFLPSSSRGSLSLSSFAGTVTQNWSVKLRGAGGSGSRSGSQQRDFALTV